jgi:hypothetical protein
MCDLRSGCLLYHVHAKAIERSDYPKVQTTRNQMIARSLHDQMSHLNLSSLCFTGLGGLTLMLPPPSL